MTRVCFWLWKTNTYLANPTPLEWMVSPSTTTIGSKGFFDSIGFQQKKVLCMQILLWRRRKKKRTKEEVVILFDKSFTTQPKCFSTILGFAWWEVEYTKTKEHQSWIILHRFLILVKGKARQGKKKAWKKLELSSLVSFQKDLVSQHVLQ
jgi:hypothetical protein